jgi:hypothetical protein
MKKIFLFVFVSTLIFSACDKSCKLRKLPKDIKPIDWENYNDVYSVKWNNINKCIEKDYSYNIEKKKIKVYGWVKQDPSGHNDFSQDFIHGFTLIDDQTKIFADNLIDCGTVGVSLWKDVKVDTNAIISKKQCYVEGELFIECLPIKCPSALCIINVYSSDDIYFK